MNCPLCGSDVEEDNDIDVPDMVFCIDKECPGNDYGFTVMVDAEGIKYLAENI
ncbi:MAG: hypothetical protein ACXAC5_04685 [Promethearchaeota archaeon]|jgi:hypothetical protein